MSCSALDTVSVVDTTLSGFLVHIKVPEVVVEIYIAGAEVASKKRSMGSEDGSDVDMTLTAEGNPDTGEPFVKVGDDGRLALVGNKLLLSNKGGKELVSSTSL